LPVVYSFDRLLEKEGKIIMTRQAGAAKFYTIKEKSKG